MTQIEKQLFILIGYIKQDPSEGIEVRDAVHLRLSLRLPLRLSLRILLTLPGDHLLS